MKQKILYYILIFVMVFGTASPAFAGQDEPLPDRETVELPENVSAAKLDSPVQLNEVSGVVLEPGLVGLQGDQQVVIQLLTASVAKQKVTGKAAQRAKTQLIAEQADLLSRVVALDPEARVIAQVQLVLNAVFVEVDASVLDTLASDPAVARIARVGTYELDLSETVPYIGGTAVQGMGYDGTGVRVAVLDSGIDYTHAALGGSGAPADFAANDPDSIEPGTFPTAKVVGGYDFVGSAWPSGPLAFDPDPLDAGPGGGHGTHVADIIGGASGVAPGVDLYAVKVCSSVSSSCSGLALIMGMEFVADPNGDGNPADHVDLINMSLGSSYGQPFDDDLSAAVDNATALGVLTVASAGNSAEKPYANGTPSSAATALSVAQTQVPSAALQLLTVGGEDYPAVFQPWSVFPTGPLSGPVQYGDGAGGNLNGCAAFPAGSLAGKVVLVDRGACNFTLKIKNISMAGGLVGIIGLVAPGAPFSGGDGGDRPIDIPGYMISQADANAIKASIPSTAVVDPANQLPLVGQMVGSSARGPQHESTTLIKPEIGAPGASVSAIAGTGTGTGAFGGTSGAAPMVTGSAALLLQASPELSPLEAKARLMNTGETEIYTDPFSGLAPITRIGGGEVRVDHAVSVPAAAWDAEGAAGALSFGFVNIDKDVVNLHKTVTVHNYSNKDIEYTITPTFRYADDEDNGAVAVQTPSKVKVKAGKDATFPVKLTVYGDLLRGNHMNSGSMGADPSGLTLDEYDGYLVLDDGSQPIHLAWHILPRKAANVVGRETLTFSGILDEVALNNNGVGTAQIDSYALLAVSPNLPEGPQGGQAPTPDLRAVGVKTFLVPDWYCSSQFVWAFAINTWEPQQHLMPVSYQVVLDTNQDGLSDYIVLNRDVSFSDISDGRQLSWVYNLSTGRASAYFYAEHAMNTGNTVLNICGEQVGLTAADILATNVGMDVYATDFYYGGPGDAVSGLSITPWGEQHFASSLDIPGETNDSLRIYRFPAFPENSPELGLLLFTNGDRGAGNRGGATPDTEALLLMAP